MKLTTSAVLTAFLFISAAGDAYAGNDPAQGPTQAAPASDVPGVTIKPNPDDKVICKYQTPIGSRLGGKRVCMKKSDWDQQARIARDQVTFHGPAGIAGSH